jgi:hypothetical protein
MEQIIIELVSKYPVTASIFLVVGILRAVFKPIFSLAEAYVKATPSQEDDQKLNKFMSSNFYKRLSWGIDYLSSIKLPAKK